jgi:hypothetical protein
MVNQSQNMSVKSYSKLKKNNPLESLKDNGFDDFDSFYPNEGPPSNYELPQREAKKPAQTRKEFSLFSYQEYYEKELIKKQIKELTELIRREIEAIKKTNKALLNEVKDIQNIVLNQDVEKPGIYHVRFLETVLGLLRVARAKVNESGTWLQAMTNKRKKRGSAFAVISKKKGTQFSLSTELQSARSIQ